MPSTSLIVDRGVLVAAVVLSCVLFTSAASDPVNVVKLTAVMLCALALGASHAYRVLRHRVLRVPVGPAAWVLLALLIALIVSAVVAPVTGTAVIGASGRNSGLLAYLSALVLFVTGITVLERPHTRVLVGGVVAAGAFTAIYGLLQRLGIDAVPWNNPFNPVIAALGNPNFASGYLGIATSVAAGGALWSGWAAAWRLASGATAALALAVSFLSNSVQGPIAAAAGMFVLAAAYVLGLAGQRRRLGAGALLALALLGAAGLLLGWLRSTGPFAGIFTDIGSKARVHYWEAAVEMFREHPWLGVGLDQYGHFWRSNRTPESVELLGGADFSDAAHSVPLQVLAQGGVLLGFAYAAFVVLVAVTLVRGLQRLEGPDRMLLAAVGAGWAAYQVQSAVSIDQVPLIVLHFTLAGAVLAAAPKPAFLEIRLPGARPVQLPAQPRGKRSSQARALPPANREPSLGDLGGLALVSLALAVAAWQALDPLRASIAVAQGDDALANGDGNRALSAYARAADLLPSQSAPWEKQGALFMQVEQPARASHAWRQALDRDPRSVYSLRNAGTLAESSGDLPSARQLFERLLEVDPLNPNSVLAAAQFELRHGGADAARGVLETLVREVPNHPDVWASLGDARLVLGDPDLARAAYVRALEIEPQQPTALVRLPELDRSTAK